MAAFASKSDDSELARYVPGERLPADRSEKICGAFLLRVREIADVTLKKLLIVAEDKAFKMNAFELRCSIDAPARDVWYVIMGSCHIDRKLIQWGRDFGIPRGFPILFNPVTKEYRTGGFYPKFSNDTRQLDNSASYHGVTRIKFFKKWSGFLCQVIAWKLEDGTLCWTTTSKNSADGSTSEFVRNGATTVRKYMTKMLTKYMVTKGLHFCMELLHEDDQCHGAAVLRSDGIVTMVGSGRRSGKAPSAATFVDYWELDDVVKMCSTFGLPCDSLVTVEGEANCAKFLAELAKLRDFIDDHMMEELIDRYGERTQGTRCHANILGSVLEGLVLKLTANGTERTEKYKFARYTIRTMLVRSILSTISREKLDYGYMLSPQAFAEAQEFVGRWCVTDSGRKYWLRKFKTIAVLLAESQLGSGILADPRIAPHIAVCDAADAASMEGAYDEVAKDDRIKPRGITLMPREIMDALLVPAGYAPAPKPLSGRRFQKRTLENDDIVFLSTSSEGIELRTLAGIRVRPGATPQLSKAKMLLPRLYDGNEVPNAPAEKKITGMVRSLMRRVMNSGGSAEFYDAATISVEKVLEVVERGVDGKVAQELQVQTKSLAPEVNVYFHGFVPALGKSSLSRALAQQFKFAAREQANERLAKKPAPPAARAGNAFHALLSDSDSDSDSDGEEERNGDGKSNSDSSLSGGDEQGKLRLVVRHCNGDLHQKKGNKSSKFWSAFGDVLRPIDASDADVVLRIKDKALCPPDAHVRRVFAFRPSDGFRVRHVVIIPEMVLVKGFIPSELLALALYRMANRHSHENGLLGTTPGSLNVVFMFSRFGVLSPDFFAAQDAHIIVAPIMRPLSAAHQKVAAPLLTLIRKHMQSQRRVGKEWALSPAEEAALRKELLNPQLRFVFDAVQRKTEQLAALIADQLEAHINEPFPLQPERPLAGARRNERIRYIALCFDDADIASLQGWVQRWVSRDDISFKSNMHVTLLYCENVPFDDIPEQLLMHEGFPIRVGVKAVHKHPEKMLYAAKARISERDLKKLGLESRIPNERAYTAAEKSKSSISEAHIGLHITLFHDAT